LLIKYIKSVLWRVAKCLSYIEEARCLKVNLLKPTCYLMHHHFNIQQLYAVPTLYLCVLYLSENKQRIVPLTAQIDWFL